MGKTWCELYEHIANLWLLRENYVAISVLSAGSAVLFVLGCDGCILEEQQRFCFVGRCLVAANAVVRTATLLF